VKAYEINLCDVCAELITPYRGS